MKPLAYLVAGLVLGALGSALAHDVPCPACPPCVVALTPEQAAEVEAMKAQVEALAQ